MERKTLISLCFGCMALVSTPIYAQQEQTIKLTALIRQKKKQKIRLRILEKSNFCSISC